LNGRKKLAIATTSIIRRDAQCQSRHLCTTTITKETSRRGKYSKVAHEQTANGAKGGNPSLDTTMEQTVIARRNEHAPEPQR